MKRALTLFTPVLVLLTSACGMVASPPVVPHVAAPVKAAESIAPLPAEPVASADAPSDYRKVGDFSVHRFSGTYQKAPLMLTEEIVAKEDDLWVIDYTLEEPAGANKLRVRFDPRTDSVVRVAKVEGEHETTQPISAYERMIDRTSFAADSNDGELATSAGTCLVGPTELECETKSYKVHVGRALATLNVSRSNSVPNGDVSGDIIAKDGTVIYRSELVELGSGDKPKLGVASR